MIAWGEIFAIAGAVAAVIAGLVLLITNLEKLNNYRKNLVTNMRKREAKIMCEHYQELCKVVAGWDNVVVLLQEIKTDLSQVKKEVKNNQEATTSILGDALLQKAQQYIKQRYLPEEYWKQLLKDFLTYHNSGGNGLVMLKVDCALKLPEFAGSEPRDIDLSYIIEIERNRRL
jgi:hypothetical protein